MAMKDMKITAAERKAREKMYKVNPGSPVGECVYPYGLTLRLEKEALEKLGMDTLPKVGSKMRVAAVAVVTEVRSSQSSSGSGSKCVELQIQKLDLSAGGGADSAQAAMDEAIEEADED